MFGVSKALERICFQLDWWPKKQSCYVRSIHEDSILKEVRDKTTACISEIVSSGQTMNSWNFHSPLSKRIYNQDNVFHLKPHFSPMQHQNEVIQQVIQNETSINSICFQSPCASGKTFIMLTLSSLISQKTNCCILYITNSSTAAVQVYESLFKFFDIDEDAVVMLDKKEKCSTKLLLGERAKLVISTYSVLTLHLENENFKAFANILYSIPKFGVIMYDEVHQAPAECYENALALPSPCKIAASATVFRLDNNIIKIKDYVGPLFHKINRLSLVERNVIPDVQVQKIEMDSDPHEPLSISKATLFFDMLLSDIADKKTSISFFETIKELDDFHAFFKQILEKRGLDSVLLPSLSGKVESPLRNKFIDEMRTRAQNSEATVLFMSKVGQIAYDFLAHSTYEIRCATVSGSVAIQRIGRAQRKLGEEDDIVHKAVVFVATKTKESNNFEARKGYLQDEGYEILTKLASTHVFSFLTSLEDEEICGSLISALEHKEKPASKKRKL
tara:strand:+ start:177 stop:1685 length:1509 start_codon:yes stop_codon:yes gene_type:complete